MLKRYPGFLIAGLLFLVTLAAPAQAQQDAEDPQATRVTVGDGAGTPGASVVVPIYFTPGEGVEVGRLKLTVSYVSRNLKYSRIDRGLVAELGEIGRAHV